MSAYFVTEEMLDDPDFLADWLRHVLTESPTSVITLTLQGLNERLGPVPAFLADPKLEED